MTVYTFMKTSYFGERIVVPGEMLSVPDDTHPGAHMIEEIPDPEPVVEAEPIFWHKKK